MKSIVSILLIIAFIGCGPAVRMAADSTDSEQKPFSWSQFWQELKQDWINVGHEAKDAGTQAGRKIKEEFHELPANVREGFKKTKEDAQNTGNQSAEPPVPP